MKSAKSNVQIWRLLTFSTVFVPLIGIYGEMSIYDAGSGFLFKLTESIRMYQPALYFGPYKITSFSGLKEEPSRTL